MIFGKNFYNELERVKSEKEIFQSQLKERNKENKDLKEKVSNLKNKIKDLNEVEKENIQEIEKRIKELIKTTERSDFGNPRQKQRKIKEQINDLASFVEILNFKYEPEKLTEIESKKANQSQKKD